MAGVESQQIRIRDVYKRQLLLYPFGRALSLSPWFSFFALVATLSFGSFVYYSFFPKPETLLFFFNLITYAGVYKLRLEKKRIDIFRVAFVAGLAMASKANGVFFLPLIAAVILLNHFDNKSKENWGEISKRIIVDLLLMFSVAVGIYLLLNLRWLVDFQSSINPFFVAQDHYWKKPGEIWTWGWTFSVLSYGYFIVASYLGWLGLTIWRLQKKSFRTADFDGITILTLFPLVFYIYISLHMHHYFPAYYLLIIFPLMLVGAFQLWFLGWEKITMKCKKKWQRGFILAAFLGLFLIGDWNRFAEGNRMLQSLDVYKRQI